MAVLVFVKDSLSSRLSLNQSVPCWLPRHHFSPYFARLEPQESRDQNGSGLNRVGASGNAIKPGRGREGNMRLEKCFALMKCAVFFCDSKQNIAVKTETRLWDFDSPGFFLVITT